MSLPPRDAAERARALDITTSFCVQAPAGSGKTELLTQRLLKLLANVEQPEEILAFTFTRKAAAEMRKRVMESLQQARERQQSPGFDAATLASHQRLTHELAAAVLEHDAHQGWHLLANGKRLRLNTIDSFTAALASQLPLSANLGARPSLTTDIAPVQRAAIHALLAQLDASDSIGAALRTLLPHLQNNLGAVENLLMALLGKREQWLGAVVQLGQQPLAAKAMLEGLLVDLVEEQLQLAAAALQPQAALLTALVRFAASNLLQGDSAPLQALAALPALPQAAAAALPEWRALVGFLLTGNASGFRSPKGLTGKQGFPAKKEARDAAQEREFSERKQAFGELVFTLESAGCLPLLQSIGRLPDPHYSARQWELLGALATLLPALAAELHVAMQRAGTVDHTETSLAALRALGSLEAPSELALRLDYRIRHLLVDEFQDTSTLQYQLLQQLTQGWQNGDGRTLFIVGDGMQSCYAFRNAKVSLFLKIRNEGLGDLRPEPLALQVNFRSDASVVQWVNRVFAPSFPALDDLARGGVRYSASVARAETASEPGVSVTLWHDAEGQRTPAAVRQALEAESVASLCERWQREQPTASLAVLVRNRSHLLALAPALRACGLRWNASKLDSLLSYPDISDLFTLLRAVLSLADTTAWLALLRTPFVGLALPDVLAIGHAAHATRRSVWSTLQQAPALSDDATVRLQRVLPALQRARAQRQHLPLREWLETLWIELGGPLALVEPRILDNVASFFALVEEQDAHGDITDIHAFEAALAQSYGSTLDPTVNLHVMTIHNAKGLEFDGVILPSLERRPRRSDKELLLWHDDADPDSGRLPLLGLLPRAGETDALYDYLRFEAEQRERLETTRLLYIGVTRAARQCWLFGYASTGKQGLQASNGSLLQTILPTLLSDTAALQVTLQLLPPPAVEVAAAALPRLTTQPLRRLPATWQPLASQPSVPPAPEPLTTEPGYLHLRERRIGELVHLGLRQLVEHGPHWLRPDTLLPLWRSELRPLCEDATALAAACATVRNQLLRCLQDPQVGWLFQQRQHDDHCEYALLHFVQGQRRDHVIDRTFIGPDGARWIIDYKSSAPATGQPLAAFLAAQEQQYRPQLQRYRQLFDAAERPLRCALLFSSLPLLHELIFP